MMKLETERLLIFPLSYNQLVLYLQGDNKLEEELNLTIAPRIVPPELVEAIKEIILPAVADASKDYLYATLWTVVSKEQRQMVADLCFKGEPTENGEVEIGYGTYDAFQGKGYMTEALKALMEWALCQPGVTAIIAETEKTNFASHRTLEKNLFTRYKEVESMDWWKLEKQVFDRSRAEAYGACPVA